MTQETINLRVNPSHGPSVSVRSLCASCSPERTRPAASRPLNSLSRARSVWRLQRIATTTPAEFSFKAAYGLLNCDRRGNSSFSTQSVDSGRSWRKDAAMV